MEPSIEGFLVSAVLFTIGYFLGAPLIIGLFASLAFGTTAFVTLTALGGSTPLIYTLFASALVASVAMRKDIMRALGVVFTKFPTAWIVLALAIYSIISAIIFPRLFAGQTTAFVIVEGAPTELPLNPTSGNITQTAYFTLGALIFYAFSILLLKADNLKFVRRGFFVFVISNATLGLLDLGAKLAGMGDVLLPIRTASYSLLIEVEQAGFWRIAGGFSEASAFGAASLACLAFSYAYWRTSKSGFAFGLTGLFLLLVLLSTSSAAYGGLALMSVFPLMSLVKAAFRNQFGRDDILLLALGSVTLALVISTFLYDETLFEPVVDLVQTTILDKPLSDSGKERAYWNEKSLQSFFDTNGMGIGMGSSRSSSWIISVLSQLGTVGTLLMFALTWIIYRGMGRSQPTLETLEIFALAAGARAAVLASLVASCLGGSGADPGILFFIALSVVLSCRTQIQRENAFGSEFRIQEAGGKRAVMNSP